MRESLIRIINDILGCHRSNSRKWDMILVWAKANFLSCTLYLFFLLMDWFCLFTDIRHDEFPYNKSSSKRQPPLLSPLQYWILKYFMSTCYMENTVRTNYTLCDDGYLNWATLLFLENPLLCLLLTTKPCIQLASPHYLLLYLLHLPHRTTYTRTLRHNNSHDEGKSRPEE